jgi:hypothetical protein
MACSNKNIEIINWDFICVLVMLYHIIMSYYSNFVFDELLKSNEKNI